LSVAHRLDEGDLLILDVLDTINLTQLVRLYEDAMLQHEVGASLLKREDCLVI
jgi:hypothetical protein